MFLTRSADARRAPTRPSDPLPPAARRTGIALVVAVLAAVIVVITASTGRAEAEPARIRSVQFDLAADPGIAADDGPLSAAVTGAAASYVSLQVERAAGPERLRPLTAGVTVTSQAAHGTLVAELGGLRIGPDDPAFDQAVADAFTSRSVQDLVRIDTGAPDATVTIDLRLPRALGPDDALLVQDGGGDASIEIAGLAPDGTVVAPLAAGAPPYAWNTGHHTIEGIVQWVAVVDGPAATDGQPITGLRLRTARAELKVLVLEPTALAGANAATASPPAPSDVASAPVAAATSSEPVAAAGPEATPATPVPAPASPPETPNPPTGASTPPDPGQGDRATPAPTEVGVEADVAWADGQRSVAGPDAAGGATEVASPSIDLAVGVLPAVAVGGVGCEEALEVAAAPAPDQGASTFCFAVTNTGSTPVSEINITDPRAGLANAVLPRSSGPTVLQPGQQVVFYHHATPTTDGASTVAEASATVVADDRRVSAATDGAVADVTDVTGPAVTALAMTGVATEPWTLVALATGLMFFGYTIVVAFRRPRHRPEPGEAAGHAQLDALGFE